MKQLIIKKEIIEKLTKCQKEFDKNLKNKKVMFIYETKDRKIHREEMYFPLSSFYHLTGIQAYDVNNEPLNSYRFYELLLINRIDEQKIQIKDATTYYKLSILLQLMRIDKNAKMIGDFCGSNIFLQTDKVTGNINACMGFIKENNIYIPNTVLKDDIRNIVNNQSKIIAIFKKEITENLYKNITYLKKEYEVKDILINNEIKKNIDVDNIFSNDKIIDKKILNFN